jgi:hypothetical protein
MGNMTASSHLHSVQSHRQVEGTSEGSTITLSLDNLGTRLAGPGVGGKTALRSSHHRNVMLRSSIYSHPAFPRSADPNSLSSAITDHISHEVI